MNETQAKRKGIQEAHRWRDVVEQADKPKKLAKPDVLVKEKVVEYSESKYYIKSLKNLHP
jgi:hypothetical protein